MQQFVVPQFIDVEDKIFGPITARQFVILLVATLIIFLTYKLADITLFIFLTLVIGGLALVFAFVKVNGQPFHYVILSMIQTLRRPSLRVWNKTFDKSELTHYREESKVVVVEKIKRVPKLSYSRIRDLSLVVNTGGYYKPE
ncbi:MAG: hypothetical protein COU29_00560 [Candidatus Magasanikbacteria bacterium CG10_big_fil_rev_8_21_14_0_10_36_32]|uniref:PrgI family protein n=1 Tax=Candidatus Magasanikbacteria bacterium CG10_big_fil_rev_8_21_14_0_10_36_32 TaxID=1974646 RepID=A0A2M6W7G3_9BACT|nr:MAG: hypothetical protein COU29_00560 [Candidatus Magasanikbacteria bacterium CG10_big_fil_rev_8_21_14_0_10_36_32]